MSRVNDLFRSAYGPKDLYNLDFSGTESMTKQSFADECDINNILAKHALTGLVDHVQNIEPQYGDFLNVVDYHFALNAINSANEYFMSLPAEVRQSYSNDPANFLEHVQRFDLDQTVISDVSITESNHVGSEGAQLPT